MNTSSSSTKQTATTQASRVSNLPSRLRFGHPARSRMAVLIAVLVSSVVLPVVAWSGPQASPASATTVSKAHPVTVPLAPFSLGKTLGALPSPGTSLSAPPPGSPLSLSSSGVSTAAPSPPSQPPKSSDALAALQQSVNAQSGAAQSGAASSASSIDRPATDIVTPYTVPVAGQGIYSGSSQTLREISYLNAEKDLISARTARETALGAQAEAHAKLVEDVTGKKAKKASDDQPDKPDAAASQALAVPKPIEPVPYVNSVYSYGDAAYAEIVLGSNKVVATRGTMLINGDKVLSISPTGVVVSNKGKRSVLLVRGSASSN